MEETRNYTVPKYRVRYAEDFKHQICREFLSGNYTKEELQKKYAVKGKSRLLGWLRELGYISANSIQPMRKPRVKKPKKRKPVPEDIKELENALQDAELKAEVYRKMIEIAEQQYKIKIRKNSNTK